MFTIIPRRALAFALATAGIAACVPGVASAAKHDGARAGSHVATTQATSQARHVATSPLGGLHGSVLGTGTVEIQGGSTGDGKLGEEACERLGELADEASDRGRDAMLDGNGPQAQNSFDYAEAIVDYGLDNGCFFVW
jgi:hypothetical protein